MLWEILKAGRTNKSSDLFTRLAARRVSVSKRGYIVLPHDIGTFNATAKGNNIIWEYNGERIQGNTCSFNVLRDNGTIRLAFDEALERLEIKDNNALKADLSDLGGKLTYYLNLYNCKNITGSLADLGGKLTHYLSLYNCRNITGSLADLGGKLDNTLSLSECSNITGSLADLGGALTYFLDLSRCSNITGSLADLGGALTYFLNLSGCQKITGVYSGNSYPTVVNLSYTGLTAADMDQTLINFNAGATRSGTFTAKGMTRTAASDDAVAGLTANGWTVTGLTKV